jgi:hypothetical protein
VLLALLWPTAGTEGFLPALSCFCRLLRHPELRTRLRASGSPAEAYAWIQSFEGRNWARSGGNSSRTGRARLSGLLREARA